MARYKEYDYGQMKMIPVSFERQILPGSFEYSLSYLIELELDLTAFDQHYINNDNGHPAYDSRLLLNNTILAYSKGITSSRQIENLCRENSTFMALSFDTQPHLARIADFFSRSPEAIAEPFFPIVLMCDKLGLIGKEMFAIDGCKLPFNASKEWSGTYAEPKKKKQKIDRAVRRMLQCHREEGTAERQPDIHEREAKQIKKLRAVSRKLKQFLDTEETRTGVSGCEVKNNITDNESAKMKTSHGVVQGYTGVAAVDSKLQVVVYAEAFGQGQEHGLLQPVLEGINETFNHGHRGSQRALKKKRIIADSGCHYREMLEYLKATKVDGYISGTGLCARDPCFKDYKTPDERNKRKDKKRFSQEAFTININKKTCRCPAGHAMWL